MIVNICRDSSCRPFERCSRFLPCLSDPGELFFFFKFVIYFQKNRNRRQNLTVSVQLLSFVIWIESRILPFYYCYRAWLFVDSKRLCFYVLGTWISARRSALGLKVALVMLHLIYPGLIFLFDGGLIEKTKKEPWYANASLLLLIAFHFWWKS